jgi:hypothetical protein
MNGNLKLFIPPVLALLFGGGALVATQLGAADGTAGPSTPAPIRDSAPPPPPVVRPQAASPVIQPRPVNPIAAALPTQSRPPPPPVAQLAPPPPPPEAMQLAPTTLPPPDPDQPLPNANLEVLRRTIRMDPQTRMKLGRDIEVEYDEGGGGPRRTFRAGGMRPPAAEQ